MIDKSAIQEAYSAKFPKANFNKDYETLRNLLAIIKEVCSATDDSYNVRGIGTFQFTTIKARSYNGFNGVQAHSPERRTFRMHSSLVATEVESTEVESTEAQA